MDSEADSDAMSEETATNVDEQRGCCGCCDNYKTLDELFFDICLRPVVNFLLGWFSQPTSIHLVIYFGGGSLLYRYLEGWSYDDSFYFLAVTATTGQRLPYPN